MKIYEHKALTYKGRVIFEKLVTSNFKRVPKVFQEKEACFMFVEHGEFCMRTPENVLSFKSGESMLAKCGNYFFEQTPQNKEIGNEKITIIGAYFYPEVLEEIFNYETAKSSFQSGFDITKVNVDVLLLNFKENINFLLDNPAVADETLVLTKLKEFILLLTKTENAPSVIDFVSSLFKPLEYDFKAVVENNLYASLSLNELANLCGMSSATFKRNFSNIYTESPRKYISRRKVQKASQMLISKENRVGDIAFECGFESIATFNRVFKKHFGKSPSEYRGI